MKRYPAAEWEEREKTCKYKCLCPEFYFDHYFCNEDLSLTINCNYNPYYFRLSIDYGSGL